MNELSLSTEDLNGPMRYPFLTSREGLQEFLVSNEIYVSTFWDGVLRRVEKDSLEYRFAKFLLPLPVDQRYGTEEMQFIVDRIVGF